MLATFVFTPTWMPVEVKVRTPDSLISADILQNIKSFHLVLYFHCYDVRYLSMKTHNWSSNVELIAAYSWMSFRSHSWKNKNPLQFAANFFLVYFSYLLNEEKLAVTRWSVQCIRKRYVCMKSCKALDGSLSQKLHDSCEYFTFCVLLSHLAFCHNASKWLSSEFTAWCTGQNIELWQFVPSRRSDKNPFTSLLGLSLGQRIECGGG